MKIALLGAYPIRLFAEELGVRKPPSNTTSWNLNLAKGLAAIPGNEVHFITINPSIPKDQILTSDGVILHFLSAPAKARILTLFQYNKIKIHRKLDQICPDIVHGHGTEHEYPYIAATSGYPFTITIHCVLSDILRGGGLGFGKRMRFKLSQHFERIALQSAQSIIVTTEYMIPAYEQCFPGKKWFIVNNSVSPLFFEAKEAEELRRGFLYIGRISPEKDVLTLLNAFRMVTEKVKNQINLRIVGAINDKDYYREIESFIDRSNLKDKVSYEGLKSQEEISRMMLSSLCVVLPSRYDAYGLVLAEAMAVGIPVIATRVGGVPYVVKDGETGFLVESGDVETLADKMIMLLNDRGLRDQMGKKGKQEASTRFHPEVVAQKTRDVYEQVLAEWKS